MSFDAKELAESSELLGVEGFSKYIGCVVVGIDVIEDDFLGLDALAKEMVFDIDVFDAVVKHWIFGEIYWRVVIA